MDKIGQYWKAVVAAAGAALMVWNQYGAGFSGILPESWQGPIAAVVGLLTVVATWGVRNKPAANPA